MNSTFTPQDMRLLIDALIHMYLTFKTTYHESRDPWDQKMMYDYRDILLKVEDLTGQRYISPEPKLEPEYLAAIDKVLNGSKEDSEPEEIPNNVLDFRKRRKDD